jgi:DNA-binding response OmpR family regulator
MTCTSTTSILLAEEDAATRVFLADNLTADGYAVLLADSRGGAIRLLETRQPALVICDVNGDTLELLDAVRTADGLASRIEPTTPLIILTAHRDELARVRYLDRGGDDVVTKPYSYAELRARIRALLRRADRHPSGRVRRVGEIVIDTVGHEVHVGPTRLELTSKEFTLLCHLAGDPARVFSKDELLRDVWGDRGRGSTRTLDSHACVLRRKLAAASPDARWVQNVWGVGYRLAPIGANAAGDGGTLAGNS